MGAVYTETVVANLESESTELFSGDVDVKRIDPNTRYEWRFQNSISLDELDEIVCELREKGANRVEISYHSDHGHYQFVGTNLEQNLDPKAELAVKINAAKEDLALRIKYHSDYTANISRLEELIARDKTELEELIKQYEA